MPIRRHRITAREAVEGRSAAGDKPPKHRIQSYRKDLAIAAETLKSYFGSRARTQRITVDTGKASLDDYAPSLEETLAEVARAKGIDLATPHAASDLSAEELLAACVESVWEEHFASTADDVIARAAATRGSGRGGGRGGRGGRGGGRGVGVGGRDGSGRGFGVRGDGRGRGFGGRGDGRGGGDRREGGDRGGRGGGRGGRAESRQSSDADASPSLTPDSGTAAVGDDGHTGADAARALRDWIMSTNDGKPLDPRMIGRSKSPAP